MDKVTKIGLIAGAIAFIVPLLLSSFLSDFNSIMFGITMVISLVLVLGVYSGIKHQLFNVMNGIYERRPLFQAGIKVAILVALIHSFGMMANEYVNKDHLYEIRIASAEANIQNMVDSGEFEEEEIKKQKELLAERIEKQDVMPPNIMVYGATRVIWVMIFGALYSFVIPIVLKNSPNLKGIKKS